MRICLLKRVGVQENLLRKHSWKHHPPLLKAGGRTFQTFSHLGGGEGYQKFGWKVGINLKRWVGWYRNGGIATFLLIYIFNCIYSVCARARARVCVCVCLCVCVRVGGVKFYYIWFFSLLSWFCMILIPVFIVTKHFIISIFLIHSDSVQKMLTALFI